MRLNVFSGTEKTYQSWNGVPEYLLATDRTYNSFTYSNQTDNYQQDHYQLLTSHTLSPNLTFNVNLHYTKGKGYYEEYKENQKFSGYGLPDIQIKDSTIKSTDLIRRKWLDNDFYGTTFSLDYQSFRKLSATIGGGWNKYNGNHYGEIIWAKYASASNIGYRWYESNSKKTDFNIYAKINYQLAEVLNAFVDLQGRFIAYDMKGTAKDRQDITQSSEYQFFNPKFGLTLDLDAFSHVYASYSIGNKEPSRQDFIDNTPKRPLAEKLGDVELGYKLQRGKFAFGLNGYYMDYTNQLVLTGKVNDVGEAIRLNVPESYRLGIEVEAGAQLTSTLKINANATFSKNKIKNFTETLPNYDDGGVEKENKYAETDISFSPNVILGSQILYTPLKGLEFGLLSKYVGKQYLDNTTNESRKLNSYFTNDIRAIYSLKGKALKNVTLTALVNNVFNTLYESNGYSYSYIYEGKVATENFYFPQAGTNVLFGISLKF
ncbi:TonB-dependent receptor [Pseudarcicella hirudinis]|uniref:TonB-dependent receptor n=1 Tax=Pseudarcicella hirudinis TaxID=1079859 RepID=UPI0035EF79F0